MDIAHYKCMTMADWVAVRQERLMVDMPLKINWDNLDSKLLTSFFERYPERKAGLYEYAPSPDVSETSGVTFPDLLGPSRSVLYTAIPCTQFAPLHGRLVCRVNPVDRYIRSTTFRAKTVMCSLLIEGLRVC
jgi:hypothetical protein